METLNYGYKKPENNDLGAAFWNALSSNIERLANHSHDGVNSATIDISETGVVEELDNTDWTVDGNWKWKLVTFPSGYTYGVADVKFFLGSGTYNGERFFPKVAKMSSTSMKVYMPYTTEVDSSNQFTVPTTISVVFS